MVAEGGIPGTKRRKRGENGRCRAECEGYVAPQLKAELDGITRVHQGQMSVKLGKLAGRCRLTRDHKR